MGIFRQTLQVPRRLLLYTESSVPTGHADGLAPGCWRAGENPLTLAQRGPVSAGRSPSSTKP